MTVKQYYDKHLAGIYSWMAGDIDEKAEEFYSSYTHPLNILPYHNLMMCPLYHE